MTLRPVKKDKIGPVPSKCNSTEPIYLPASPFIPVDEDGHNSSGFVPIEKQMHILPLRNISYPCANDVRCGKGQGANYHRGCRDLRATVEVYLAEFVSLPRSGREADKKKRNIASNIVKHFRCVRNSRFLRQDPQTELWNDIGDEAAEDKVLQLLRDLKKKKKRPVASLKAGANGDDSSTQTGMGSGMSGSMFSSATSSNNSASVYSNKSQPTVQYHYAQMEQPHVPLQAFGKHRRSNSELSSENSNNSIATTTDDSYSMDLHRGMPSQIRSPCRSPSTAFSRQLRIDDNMHYQTGGRDHCRPSPPRRMRQNPPASAVAPVVQRRAPPASKPWFPPPSSHLDQMGGLGNSKSDSGNSTVQEAPPSPFSPPRSAKKLSKDQLHPKNKEIYARPLPPQGFQPQYARQGSRSGSSAAKNPNISFKRTVWEKIFDTMPAVCGAPAPQDLEPEDHPYIPQENYAPQRHEEAYVVPRRVPPHQQFSQRQQDGQQQRRRPLMEQSLSNHHQHHRMLSSQHPIQYPGQYPGQLQQQHLHMSRREYYFQEGHSAPHYPQQYDQQEGPDFDESFNQMCDPPKAYTRVRESLPAGEQCAPLMLQQYPQKRMESECTMDLEDKMSSSVNSSSVKKGFLRKTPNRTESSSPSSSLLEFVSNAGDVFSAADSRCSDDKTVVY
mmetsp:Transcript_41385/g.81078  ORF Transcript_41385/g.81078 Transcript_41385/m.81078 type:complete len:668 (+) Transcript_41385:495-2498(+)|eukprot:CAMPEP_0194337352 /NCGR_PEP_ID=MMETSP0171-20130528/76025_1 /TAXON_ID=218684 /ORGANISM="Corethron pennatum, Strain L29A3" /LENGTH=667 /DNA_ID=CAMNT_0039101107 /DNA_START=448 /DNA_END=2451 /DNA_ORIENTATION=+